MLSASGGMFINCFGTTKPVIISVSRNTVFYTLLEKVHQVYFIKTWCAPLNTKWFQCKRRLVDHRHSGRHPIQFESKLNIQRKCHEATLFFKEFSGILKIITFQHHQAVWCFHVSLLKLLCCSWCLPKETVMSVFKDTRFLQCFKHYRL